MTTIAQARKALDQLAKRNARDAELYQTISGALENIGERLKAVEDLHKKDRGHGQAGTAPSATKKL